MKMIRKYKEIRLPRMPIGKGLQPMCPHCGKKILGWGINFHHIRCYFLKWKEPKQ